MELSDVSVLIKTDYRVDRLRRCLEGASRFQFGAVLVADDGPDIAQKNDLYSQMANKMPLQVIRMPQDSGLACGRNRLIEKCETEFALLIDDDQVCNKSVEILYDIIKERQYLGGVGGVLHEYGEVKCGAFDLYSRSDWIIKDVGYKGSTTNKIKGREFVELQMIPNAGLFRVEALQDTRWDPNFKIGYEHLDFFMRQKVLGKWKFGVAPEVYFKHYPGGNDKYIREMRHNPERLTASRRYFEDKWSVDGVLVGMSLIKANPSWRNVAIHYGIMIDPPESVWKVAKYIGWFL
jgi:hypothetical protein